MPQANENTRSNSVQRPHGRWFWQRSLRSRILVTYSTLFLVTLVGMGIYVSAEVYLLAIEQAEHDLEVSAFLVANALEDPLSGYPAALQQYGMVEVEEKLSSTLDGDEPLPSYTSPTRSTQLAMMLPVLRATMLTDMTEMMAAGETRDPIQGETLTPDGERDVSAVSFQTFVQLYTRSETARVSLLSTDGNVIADSLFAPELIPNQRDVTEIEAALAGAEQHEIRREPLNGLLTLYAAAPVQQGNQLLGVVRLARPIGEVMQPTQLFLLNLVIGGLVALLGAVLIGIGLSRHLVRPLQALEGTAQKIAAGELELSVPVESSDEVGALAVSFNAMVSQLRGLIEKQRHFVANASHELRTPLTNIKLRSEAVLAMEEPLSPRFKRYVTEIDSEADRLRRLANTLLNLASIEQATTGTPVEPVDIAPLLYQAARSYLLTARDAQLTLVARIPDTLCPLHVWPEQIDVIVNNLLDNAIKYSAAGGEVRLLVHEVDTGVQIVVKDQGMGIPAADLPHIFERFYRVDKARSRQSSGANGGSGAGLGLAIVKNLVASNGGEIAVASELGVGTTVTLLFPYAKSR